MLKALHGKEMKTILTVLALITLSVSSFAGDWIAVDGGIVELDLKQKEVEENLWAFLENQSDFVFQAKESYSYQYQVKTENELYINAFCSDLGKHNLHQDFLVVMDGGSCFFQATLNLLNGQFTLLGVNGEA